MKKNIFLIFLFLVAVTMDFTINRNIQSLCKESSGYHVNKICKIKGDKAIYVCKLGYQDKDNDGWCEKSCEPDYQRKHCNDDDGHPKYSCIGPYLGKKCNIKDKYFNNKIFNYKSPKNDLGVSFVIDSYKNLYIDVATTKDYKKWSSIIIKYNKNMKKLWEKEFKNKVAMNLSTDSYDNLIVSYVTGDAINNYNDKNDNTIAVLDKFNADGELIWEYKFPKNLKSEIASIAVDDDDNIFLAGVVKGNLFANKGIGDKDIFIVKLNKNGKLIWSKELGSKSEDSNVTMAINNKKIFVMGNTRGSFNLKKHYGKSDIFLIKYDLNGNILWTKQWGGKEDDKIDSKMIVSNGDILLVGTSYGDFTKGITTAKQSRFLLKLSKRGTINWIKLWEKDLYNVADIALDKDENIIVLANSSFSKVSINKFDKNGNFLWEKLWGETNFIYLAQFINIDKQNNIYILGNYIKSKNKNGGDYDLFLIKFFYNEY